MIKQDFAS